LESGGCCGSEVTGTKKEPVQARSIGEVIVRVVYRDREN
jgi:hypothetical protein